MTYHDILAYECVSSVANEMQVLQQLHCLLHSSLGAPGTELNRRQDAIQRWETTSNGKRLR
jgi:hypothetical protein